VIFIIKDSDSPELARKEFLQMLYNKELNEVPILIVFNDSSDDDE
jgi:hypothetical protein